MSTLAAIFHYTAALVALALVGVVQVLVAAWESGRNQKRIRQEVAAKLGVSVESLEDEMLSDRIVQYSSERASNELLRNRLSDVCGLVRTIWGWLGATLGAVILVATLWYTATETRDNALYAWFAPALTLFVWLTSVAFSLLCYVLTGRYPGEAKAARKGIAEYLNQRRSPGTTDA